MGRRLRAIARLWRYEAPPSILAAPPKPPSATDRLYLLRVDFPVSKDPEVKAAIDASFDRLREKYGLDFLVLEPGMTLSRFDDI